jgi:hypothetical protein
MTVSTSSSYGFAGMCLGEEPRGLKGLSFGGSERSYSFCVLGFAGVLSAWQAFGRKPLVNRAGRLAARQGNHWNAAGVIDRFLKRAHMASEDNMNLQYILCRN